MSDITHQANSTKQALLALAKQVNALGVGLQNAAPSDKTGSPNPSIQYLTAITTALGEFAQACDHVSDGDIKSTKKNLIAILEGAVAKDVALREQHQMGDKFRFIREQLQALHESGLGSLAAIKEEALLGEVDGPLEDEVVVYVYLFNAQGATVPSWRKMVHASVLYEYSVNRPIYRDLAAVEGVIRGKAEKQQHAYLAIAVKKDCVIALADEATKDAQGHVLLRVKEGSLKANRVLFFKHNEHEYRVNDNGDLIKQY